MTVKELFPRIAIVIVLLSGAAFAYLESIYLRDHAASLGAKGAGILTWVWCYRIIGLIATLAASYIIGGFWRR